MAKNQPILNPASPWVSPRSRTVTLFHGTTAKSAKAILQHGIDLSKCRPQTDFGLGFYLTSLKRQARHWAWIRYFKLSFSEQSQDQPAVLWLLLERISLAQLESLQFVLADYHFEDYWSFVQHCRQSQRRQNNVHDRPGWYDMVGGPVAADWRQRTTVSGADQFSFHEGRGCDLLNHVLRNGVQRHDYDWEPVVP